MAVVKVAEGNRLAAEHGLWAARGRAIQGYAALEQALSQLFAMSADLRYDVALVIFHKLNANPQREMTSDLLGLKFGATFEAFWQPTFKRLAKLTTTRNHIVHWSALSIIGADGDGNTIADVYLKPATALPHQFDHTDKLTIGDMETFEVECIFWTRVIRIFNRMVSGEFDAEPSFDKGVWTAIFTKPLTCPPAPDHPQAHLLSDL